MDKLPKDTIQAGNAASEVFISPINGVDTVKGVAMTGGTADGYLQVLSIFRMDSEERIQKFKSFLNESSGKFPEKHLALFTTQIHAIKSAAAAIGAAEISGKAARLEAAAKNAELSFLQDNLPGFMEHLNELLKNIRTALESRPEKTEEKSGGSAFFSQVFGKKKTDSSQSAKEDVSRHLPLFDKLVDALGSQNTKNVDRILDELNKFSLDSKTKGILEHISDQVLMTEFESAKKTIKGFIDSHK